MAVTATTLGEAGGSISEQQDGPVPGEETEREAEAEVINSFRAYLGGNSVGINSFRAYLGGNSVGIFALLLSSSSSRE